MEESFFIFPFFLSMNKHPNLPKEERSGRVDNGDAVSQIKQHFRPLPKPFTCSLLRGAFIPAPKELGFKFLGMYFITNLPHNSFKDIRNL